MTMQLAFETVSQDHARLAVRERRVRMSDPHVDGAFAAARRTRRTTGRLDDVLTALLLLGVGVTGALMTAAAVEGDADPGPALAAAAPALLASAARPALQR